MTESTPESESNNFDLWQSKPWWCQPWTIMLTGIIIIASSWLLFHEIWLTIVVAIPIFVWWTYFLIVIPRLLKNNGISESRYDSF
jgi:hypothetical protein